MLTDRSMKQVRKDSARDVEPLLFDPEEFKDKEDELTFLNHKLAQE